MKRHYCIWLALLFCALSTLSYGQSRDSLYQLYNTEVITRYGNNFQKGRESLRFPDLQQEFSFSPIGQFHYSEAKKHRTTATVLRLFSAAATIASIAFISGENRTATYVTWGGQIALNLAGFHFQTKGNQHLDRALFQRNKDLLFGR